MSTSEAPGARSRRGQVRRTGRRVAAVAGAVVWSLTAAGCGGSLPRSVSGAPVLSVATGLYPLAQAAVLIGQGKVSVTSIVPDGANPFTYRLSSSQVGAVRAAGLVVEVGGGFQPDFEAAAAGAPRVVKVISAAAPAPTGPPDPYVWLDPTTMGRVVGTVSAAMAAADPAAAALYRRNASSLEAEISSLGIDYSSTLSTCTDTTLITPDPAFSAMSATYSLKNVVVGPNPAAGQVTAAAGLLKAGRTTSVATEPWVDNSGVEQVAAAAQARQHQLDTLAGPPAGGYPRGASYFALMEQDLGELSDILGCASEGQ